MANRKKKGAIIIIIIVSTTFAGIYLLDGIFQPQNGSDTKGHIEPHPFNALNWWEVAAEIGEISDLLSPIRRIVNFGSRHLESPDTNYYDAADYLIDLLDDWGLNAGYFGEYDSVVGIQEGYADDNRAIVFGAHLDSEEGEIGVNQNAGGCGVVTLIADILRNFRLPVDIYYCYFSYNTAFLDEQMGIHRLMYGSREIAQHFIDQGIDVMAFYNFDELLFYDEEQEATESLIAEHHSPDSRGYHQTKYLADLVQAFLSNSGHDIMSLEYELDTETDHWAFWERGLPAVNIRSGHRIDPEFPPSDLVDSEDYNMEHAAALAKASAAVAVYMSRSGNNHRISFKMEQSIKPGTEAEFRTVISYPQAIEVNSQSNSTEPISLRMHGENGTVLPETSFDDGNINLTTEEEAGIGQFTVRVSNIGNSTIYINFRIFYHSDHDGNGVTDAEQYTWSDPVPPFDWDKDGLSDEKEEVYGTDIFVADTDSDGMSDKFEVDYGLNPLYDDSDEDLDGDGISNIKEMELGTSANNNDTDTDGMPDGWEFLYRTDPLTNDSFQDFDDDNLTNIEEYLYGADPYLSDSDFDGIPDAEEVARGIDPLNDDTDEDGLQDQLEIIEGLDPLSPDYDVDLSPDGSDHNPRINGLLMILGLAAIPVMVGSIIFYRRLYKS